MKQDDYLVKLICTKMELFKNPFLTNVKLKILFSHGFGKYERNALM
jgi:hypothetical protein